LSSAPPQNPPAEETPRAPAAEEIPYVPRNFWSWVAYQFFYRIGWQFKMESTLMAGIVSYFAPDPRVAGLFTTLNTVGRNLAPLVAASTVDRFRQKRLALLLFWGITIAVWGALTVYLWLPAAQDKALSIWVFGLCYTLFFVFLGASSVAQGALLGKIIPAGMRGRAMAAGMTLSGIVNVGVILLIYQVIRTGPFPEPRNYALSFSLTTTFFLMAGASLLFVVEPPSDAPARAFSLAGSLRHFVRLGRENRNLARLMAVNVSVGILGNMLPFYTFFWRASGSTTAEEMPRALMMATLFQVFWQSASSSVLGRVADHRGNRVVICSLLWVEAFIPVTALVLGGWHPFTTSWVWYIGVYVLVGLRFPVYQLLVNYLLEIVPQREHAMALGAVNAAQLVTAGAPLLLGGLAAWLGYPAAFIAGTLIGIWGAATALGLEELRVR
jgi:MFS family permease